MIDFLKWIGTIILGCIVFIIFIMRGKNYAEEK